MKKIILVLLFFNIISNTYCQNIHAKYDFSRSNWEAFKQGKIYVVLGKYGEASYDSALVNSFKQYWKFNEVKFISSDEYAWRQTSAANFFLLPFVMDIKRINKYGGQTSIELTYLSISQGNETGQLGYLMPMVRTQIGSTSSIKEQVPVFVKYLQWYCDLVYSKKVTNRKQFNKLVKNNWSKINSKPLYVLDTYLNSKIKNVNDIKKEYSGEVHVISSDELSELIKTNSDGNMFCSVEIYDYAWVYVYNIKTGELLYEKYNMVTSIYPGGLLPYHYKRWNKKD